MSDSDAYFCIKTVQVKCRNHEYNCCKLPSCCTFFHEIYKETSTSSGNRDSTTRLTNKNAIDRIFCRTFLQKKTACLEFCLRMFPRKNAWITNLKNPDLRCVSCRWSGPGSLIPDRSDHSASKQPMNPLWERIYQFLWCTMILAILNHWSWSTSSQRDAPLDFIRSILFECGCFGFTSRFWDFGKYTQNRLLDSSVPFAKKKKKRKDYTNLNSSC